MQNGKHIRINQQVKRFVSAPARFSPFSVTAALLIGQLIEKPAPQPVGKVDIIRSRRVTPQGIIYTVLKRIGLHQPQGNITAGPGTAGTSAGVIREGTVNQSVATQAIALEQKHPVTQPFAAALPPETIGIIRHSGFTARIHGHGHKTHMHIRIRRQRPGFMEHIRQQ
ncbi:hypothetical protein BvCmsOUNP049_01756 [Escherichia coli]|nr:hypothetical protein BvCmsOUNP049_01756 [Escherichia coli]